MPNAVTPLPIGGATRPPVAPPRALRAFAALLVVAFTASPPTFAAPPGAPPEVRPVEILLRAGSGGTSIVEALAPTADGGLLLAGSTEGAFTAAGNAGGRDLWVGRLGPDGAPGRVMQMGTSAWDEAVALAPLPGGGAVALAVTEGSGPDFGDPFGARDGLLLRLGTDLELDWSQRVGGRGDDVYLAVAALGDGLLLAGSSDGRPSALRLDAEGGVVWRWTGEASGWVQALAFGPEGGVHLAGTLRGGGRGGDEADDEADDEAFVAALDDGGDLRWLRRLGSAADDTVRALAPTPGGVAALLLLQGPPDGSAPARPGRAALVVAFGDRGAETWRWGLPFGGPDGEFPIGMIADGDELIVLTEASSGASGASFRLRRLTADGIERDAFEARLELAAAVRIAGLAPCGAGTCLFGATLAPFGEPNEVLVARVPR